MTYTTWLIGIVIVAVIVYTAIFWHDLKRVYCTSRYEYHKMRAAHFNSRFTTGWGDLADGQKYDYHLARARHYRGLL